MQAGKVVLAGLLALVLLPAQAQDAAESIRDVISRQLDAFRSRDVSRAFSFASPDIRRMFDTPGRFGMMVRQGYPMVWESGEATFLSLEKTPGGQSQKVMIRDGQGGLHVLRYDMIAGEDGDWLINGVRILNAERTGV